jgi:hypothetical protein
VHHKEAGRYIVGTEYLGDEMKQAAPQAAEVAVIEERLDALTWNWGDAYRIWHDDECFHARRRDEAGQLDAPDAGELHALIVAGYQTRPGSRDYDPRERM